VLKNLKEFFKTKLAQNEEMTKSLEKDIDILKNLLRIEWNINKKDQQRITELETELRQVKQDAETSTDENLKKIVELEIRLKEKEWEMELLSSKYKEVKT